eukprot:gnl/MRDRNA2_/MRDRNA2_40799_c0_seq1.p1 gnl/MRDRNA2_/MRDRNA2_40799_c0~~gnl/MRDRNA2_/MRDRNA2_40799_c0_seq1.p1  ORF type:complete len:154 (-),score=44.30 gnl/MRDRNA2_/MRDRNA2_40799_c0_seq1:50-511(-)
MLKISQILLLCKIAAVASSKPGPYKPEASLLAGAAPAAAPGGAPGPSGAPGAPGPGAAPASIHENWGADTHKEEFAKEYSTFTRKHLREPHMGDQKWLDEMAEGPGEFDLDKDFVHDTKLKSMGGSETVKSPKSGTVKIVSSFFTMAMVYMTL